MSERLLFQLLLNAKMSKFLTILWREWITFNEKMMMSALYKTNTLNWIFIKLAHRNNSSRVDMSLHSRHIMLILSQPVFALTPWSCMVSREAANTNFIVSDLTPIGLKSKIYCTQGRKLTITPLMQFHLRKSPWEMYNEFDWFCIWNCHFKKHRGAIHLII